MTGRLPPLNALRAFEATARHLSVKRAAEELCVTPGAVSQMLRSLEAHLGVPLFRRVNRGIFLTDAGQDYLPPVRNAFRLIAEATGRLDASADSGVLTVSLTPSFAALWLLPRLERFQEKHPAIDLQIRTGDMLVDFGRGGVDVAVRHGLGTYPDLRSDRVLTIEMIPVAAPRLVERLGLPSEDRQLLAWPHLHDAERQDWHLWFEALGITDSAAPRGLAFDDASLLVRAALQGQGAALVPAAMAKAEIETGRLVRLSEAAWPEAFAYYVVCPKAWADRPKTAAFREWMLAEGARS